jgi:Protein of unknown function (DUF998)
MNIGQRISRAVNDPLRSFKIFERIITVVCITIPLLLWIGDGWPKKFRSSISDYVYMCRSYIFGMLLAVAAMLFITNGAVYFRNEGMEKLNLRKQGKWYNVALGLSLLGVILFPYKQYQYPHYFFAIIFFVGNALVIGLFHQKEYRKLSVTLAFLTIGSLLPVFLGWFSLFWGEWLSLAVIGIHFYLESLGRLDLGQQTT